jgi:hypothetical protein
MTRTIHITVHKMDQLQVAEIKALTESDAAAPDTKKLAQAIIDLNQSVHDLLKVLQTIAESGALHVKK